MGEQYESTTQASWHPGRRWTGPGINSAISATVIEAVNEEIEVIGIYDGYEHLIQGRTDMVRPLTIEGVSAFIFREDRSCAPPVQIPHATPTICNAPCKPYRHYTSVRW